MRKYIDLHENWLFSMDDKEYDVSLPHTWNAEDGQDGGNDYRRGRACYTKKIILPSLADRECLFIEIGAASNTAEIFLNDVQICTHNGGYSLFRAELPKELQREGTNILQIFVDNSENDTVYPQKADFTFYGGIYRNVKLLVTDEAHFELIKDGTSGIRVTPSVDLDSGTAVITAEAWVTGGDTVRFETAGIMAEAAVENSYACTEFEIRNVHLWNGTEDPFLYDLKAELLSEGEIRDTVCTYFGCRTFRMDPDKGFFLNGRSYPLRGVSRHQDRIGTGNALTAEDMKEDMEVIRELGANTVRLAHYQHAQEFYDLCDRNGITVWAEIPMITAFMENAQENAKQQLRELITQSYHHPSIVCWGISNEITAASPVNEALLSAHHELNDIAHSLDRTRPTVMAHVFMLEKDSPLIPAADIGSYNLYFGWYLGELEQNEQFLDEYHRMFPDRVIGLSEYGADANTAFHSDSPEKGDYTEEYQCIYHEHMLDMIEARPYLWATHVWNLFDFAADGRDEGGKHGQNQKGLVEIDHRTKKDAFYLYKAAWSDEPFVHICGRRFVNRTGTETDVKVYTNAETVTLYLNGKQYETKTGNRVYVFRIPLLEETHIAVKTDKGCTDEMDLHRVETPDTSYRFGGNISVVNWFDQDKLNEDFWSVEDRMGDLNQNPRAEPIVREAMKKATASRGDVAEESSGNEMIQHMLNRMTLSQLFRQAGPEVFTEEDILQINRQLQQIRK